jgi:hypothetical protein
MHSEPPVVTKRRSLGNASNSARGKGIRSRIAQTISNSGSAAATAARSPRWRSKTVISAASRSGDQSAMSSATRW